MYYKEIIFYNHWGNGDLWASREFVKELIAILPADRFYYAHSKDPSLFFDFPEITSIKLDGNCLMKEPYVLYGESLYINTWIGYAGSKYVDGRVICSISNYKRLFNDTLNMLGINYRFIDSDKRYVPAPDFSIISDEVFTNINGYIYDHAMNTIVLVANGDVLSLQADNFDFTPIINRLADDYPDNLFIITRDYANKPFNVVLANDIIKKESGSELTELSYLSQYVDLIVGRSSGPYVFTQTKFNYNNPDLHIISFVHEKENAHMITQSDSRAKLYWSPLMDTENVYKEITKIIEEIDG